MFAVDGQNTTVLRGLTADNMILLRELIVSRQHTHHQSSFAILRTIAVISAPFKIPSLFTSALAIPLAVMVTAVSSAAYRAVRIVKAMLNYGAYAQTFNKCAVRRRNGLFLMIIT